jgi:hemerythrin-like domain-containing protein
MTTSATPHASALPLQDFSHCHEGILKKLTLLGELPALLAPARQAREIAEKSFEFFRQAIFEHHLDEERELFPAVLTSALVGPERDQVKAMIRRLTDEHRALEALWKQLAPGLKKLARGQMVEVDAAEIQRLVQQYSAHAHYEEAEFLPVSQAILSRNANDMGALGLSLHMRHAPTRVNATYI